jgi:hypothetical protein
VPTNANNYHDASLSVDFSATGFWDTSHFGGTTAVSRSKVFNCNQFNGIPSDAVVLKVDMGSYTDYFKPAGGQSLCSLLTGPNGSWLLTSTSPTGPWSPTQADSAAYLGGGAIAAGRSSPVGPYWGNRAAGAQGGCGHEAVGDAFHCGIAFTMSVSVTQFYTRYASIDGRTHLTELTYQNGFSASVASADDVRQCGDYDAIAFERLYVKITMGEFVDYLRPALNFCSMLSSVGMYYWHSWSQDGPWTLRWGNHSALLGGWAVYGTDLETNSAGVQKRVWGTFWGAPNGPVGYHGEPGGCCHSTSFTTPAFFQKFTIEVMVA